MKGVGGMGLGRWAQDILRISLMYRLAYIKLLDGQISDPARPHAVLLTFR